MFAPLIGAGPGLETLVAEVALRPVEDSDLDALFEQMRDPESVWMAAFTVEDPDDDVRIDLVQYGSARVAWHEVTVLAGRGPTS